MGKLLGGDRVSGWYPRQDLLLSVWKGLDEEVEEGAREDRRGHVGDDSGDTFVTFDDGHW